MRDPSPGLRDVLGLVSACCWVQLLDLVQPRILHSLHWLSEQPVLMLYVSSCFSSTSCKAQVGLADVEV